MLALMLSVVAGLVTTLGFGAKSVVLLVPRDHSGHNDVTLGDIGLFGLFSLTLLGTATNFFLGLSAIYADIVFCLGLAFCLRERRLLATALAIGAGTIVNIAAALLVLRWILLSAYDSAFSHYDTGLYHLQNILMTGDGPVTFGAANLHMRLGYNTLWFVTNSTFGLTSLWPAGVFVAGPLIMLFVTTAIWQRLVVAWRVRATRSLVFGALAISLCLSTSAFFTSIGTPNTDLPSNIIVLYTFFVALCASDAQTPGFDAIVALPMFVTLAVVVKLTELPIIVLLVLTLRVWLGEDTSSWRITTVAAWNLCLVGLWFARGLATSGCLLYPATVSCVPVPWRVDAATAADDNAWIRAWARKPFTSPDDIVFTGWKWLPDWLTTFTHADIFGPLKILLCLFIASLLLTTVMRASPIWHELDARKRRDGTLFTATAIAGAAFWFSTAPLVRYGLAWLVLPWMLLISHTTPHGLPLARCTFALPLRTALPCLSLVGVTALYLVNIDGFVRRSDFPHVPVPAVETRMTRNGLPILVPTSGDQCWAMRQPCTPTFSPGLEIAHFGIWRMIRDLDRQ